MQVCIDYRLKYREEEEKQGYINRVTTQRKKGGERKGRLKTNKSKFSFLFFSLRPCRFFQTESTEEKK